MAVINGTMLLIYSEGVVIAYQKGCSISVEQDLPDATNKGSGGWAEHINGMLNAKIDFNALFSGTALPVLSAKDLMDYILNRESLLISILGLGYPMVAQADMNSLSFEAPLEGTMSLSGSLKVNGPLYVLSGTSAQMITDPDAGTTDYDTLTVSDVSITSAIKSTAGAKFCQSNTISVASAGVYKLAVFLTLNSGAAPTVGLWDNTSAYISNTQLLVAGLNLVTLTSTATDASASLRFSNTANCNWSTSPIYLFKV
jgi:hypothetical protein